MSLALDSGAHLADYYTNCNTEMAPRDRDAVPVDQRNDLNAARISLENSSGSSHAAK